MYMCDMLGFETEGTDVKLYTNYSDPPQTPAPHSIY